MISWKVPLQNKTSSTKSWLNTCISYALLYFSCSLLFTAGCNASKAPKSVVYAIDVSDQTEHRITSYANTLYRSQVALAPCDSVTIYAFVAKSETVYCGPPIYSRAAFNQILSVYLKRRQQRGRERNTRTDLLLTTLERDTSFSKVGQVSLVILTDGGIESKSRADINRIIVTGRKIVANPKIESFLFAGLLPEHRQFWTDYLPKNPKVAICGSDDADAALRQITNP